MGSAESKVAAQPPLAIVASPASQDQHKPVVLCNFIRKQNKTAPATATTASSPQQTPLSSPTIEAVKDAKKPSVTSTTDTSIANGAGPPAQLTTRALSLHQLGLEDLSTQLLKAVKNGDQKLMERIAEISATKQHSIINIRGMWESTPLIYACQYCHEPIALWLLRAGANVHLVNEKGVTALLLASLEGMTAAVQQMLLQLTDTTGNNAEERIPIDAQVGVVYNSMADVNVRASPLLSASMNGHVEVVRLLLQHGANANGGVATTGAKPAPSGSGGARGGEGGNGALQFPLLVASKYGHSAVVQLLIKHGADIRETDGNENHALLLACEVAKEECALTLLRHLPVAEHAAWKRPNCHGFTALHYCAVNGLVKAAECMLRQLQWRDDAEFINASSSTRHECAVLMASRKKQVEVVKLLIECDADAMLADRGGTTAIDVLKREKRDEVVLLWQEQQRLRQQEIPSKLEDGTTTETKEVTTAQETKTEKSAGPVEGEQATESQPQELMKDLAVATNESKPEALGSDDVQSDAAGPTMAADTALLGVTETNQEVPVLHPQETPTIESISTVVDDSDSLQSRSTATIAAEPATKTTEAEGLQEPIVTSSVEDGGDSALPEMSPINAVVPSARDDETPLTASAVSDYLPENAKEEGNALDDEATTPATLLAPTVKAKSGSSKKINNRRGTGHVSQDISSAKRLGSRVGTMSAIAMGVGDGEDEDEESSEAPPTPEATTAPATHTSIPWEDSSPFFTGPTLGSLEVSSSAPVESKANDRTASTRTMTFSRELAPVVTVPTVVDKVDRGTAPPDEALSSSAAASPSPRKHSEKHKKKKKHSRKKSADADETPAKDELVSSSLDSVSKQQPEDERFASVRIQQQDERDNGALDDDF